MKVKTLSRDLAQHTRATKHDLHPMSRNLDPALHPFEAPREYKRALNAVKLDRVFAKPFVGALEGHSDGVNVLAKHPRHLQYLFSGACDGEVRIWSLPTRKCVFSSVLHQGFVHGLCMNPAGEALISVGQDKTIKISRVDLDSDVQPEVAPLTIVSPGFFTGVDHHRRQDLFATSGHCVELWSSARSEPVTAFHWGADTVNTVKFNPVEINVLVTAGDDRSVVLYDVRRSTPLRKMVLAMRTNSICWNPMEAMNFTLANEDGNLYTYDMRKLDTALNVHKDHVSAVLSVDYSPTGQEFVSGAYDKSIRIFSRDKGHSREIYHTKRMQRIFSVLWTSDAKYVVSGSDETNVRIWKADASEQMGTKAARQSSAIKYAAAVKKRFEHHPEVKRIARHRHVPKPIYSAKRQKTEMEAAMKRKTANRRKHSKPGTVEVKPQRARQLVDIET